MHRLLPIVLAALAAGVGACGGDDPTSAGASGSDAVEGSISVFAAASLTDAFDAVAGAFEDAHPGATVTLNLAGSSSLREQILEGAPADVFAPADASHMDRVVAAGLAGEPAVFATNRLQVVVPAGNPAGVDGLDDLADDDLLVGLCAEPVPCGALAREALQRAGVSPSPDTEEPHVRALLTKVEAGELDAGIVYRTDVVAAGDRVEGIEIPAGPDVEATYPIATVAGSGSPDVAAAFVAFVLGDEGEAVLREHGFGAP